MKFYYWLLKSSCFELFVDRKCSLFLTKKLMENWYLLITKKFLFSSFSWWDIRYFFEQESWFIVYIYWLLKRPCCELFEDRKYGFFNRKVNGRMTFTWCFWAFHDILGIGKYVFSCSAISNFSNALPAFTW